MSENEIDLKSMTPQDLLRLHTHIISELKDRGIARSNNNPVGDYTEWLVTTKLGLELQSNSNMGYDAVGPDGTKYEIKGRRVTESKPSRQLSHIRGLDECRFDYLMAVIFGEDYRILYAAQIPHGLISKYASFSKSTNAHILHLRDDILGEDECVDLRSRLL